jgi:hypothetical protein
MGFGVIRGQDGQGATVGATDHDAAGRRFVEVCS